jgi:putative aldouronate transport system substrate-binding protein
MKKWLSVLLTVCMMLSAVSAFAEVTQESIDAKYDPAVNITAWRFLSSAIQFENGDTIEKNIYIDRYLSDLGINLTYDWVVAEEQFDQKMNLSIVSEDLPDIMWLKSTQLKELAQEGKLYDLTELFDQYANQYAKDTLMADMNQFESAMIDGKLYAIPHTASSFDGLGVLFIRTDWLQKLNLEAPTSVDELENIIRAFATQDPDGNGVNDTFGLALQKEFYKHAHATAVGLFYGYHAYPMSWVELEDGTLAYGSVQPEIKNALLKLQQWYKEGLIDPEFGVKDKAKVKETVSAGKVGVVYGTMSSAGAFLDASVANDPNCDWQAFAVVSADSEPAKPITKMPVTRYYAVNAKSEHPEALIKLLNWSHQSNYGEQTDNSLSISPTGIAVWQYNVIGDENPGKNLNAFKHIRTAFETNDPSALNTEERGYYDRILTWRNDKNPDGWTQDRIFGEKSSFSVIEQYVDSNNFITNKFYGTPTDSMTKYMATLESMEAEVFTNIIMGEDISAFDKYVSDFYALGGTDITKEVNEWYNSVK